MIRGYLPLFGLSFLWRGYGEVIMFIAQFLESYTGHMSDESMWRAFFIASGLVLLPSASSHAASFDGAWSVLQDCNSTQEGARGYTWRYDAIVKNGHLVGQYRSKGQRPSLTLEGQVKPDGSASLIAKGISASSDYNIGFAPPQSRISFRVIARFEATVGMGSPVGVRGCKFTFNKH
jgi:hypothetical protein